MGILMRLVARVIEMLLRFTFSAALEILGFSVRLLYWSVRNYGWGKVISFLIAFWLSIELHRKFGWFSLTSATFGSMAISTLGIWGAMVGSYLWLSHFWQRRRTTRSELFPSTSTFTPQNLFQNETHANSKTISIPSSLSPISSVSEKVCPTLSSPPDKATPLWARVLHPSNLQEAWQRVLVRGGSPGSDGVTVEQFALAIDRHLQQLTDELLRGQYRPRPPRWVEIPKPNGKMRRLAILCVRDRIVQQALLLVLTPLWDKNFAPCSYAYRPGRSAQQAVMALEDALRAGQVWVVDADIESFFDSVPHAPLFSLLPDWVSDECIRHWLQICVTGVSPSPQKGLAQGAPLSPLLANLYLHRFDIALLQAGYRLIRYADDFVILCATRLQAEAALKMAERLLNNLGLSLNLEKTRIVHRDEGFTFLGYTFTREGKRPSDDAIASLQARLASTDDEEKRRQILAGWQGYFGQVPEIGNLSTSLPNAATAIADESDWTEPWWSEAGNGEPSTNIEVEAKELVLYRERFCGRSDVFARYWQTGNRKGYAPVRRTITDDEIRAHLTGQIVLGTYLLHPDGTTRALVFDIDGQNFSEVARRNAFQVAQRLASSLEQKGVTPLVEDTGGKGYHIWLCFPEPVGARVVREWAAKWLDNFRPFPEGVLVEVFPKQDYLAPNALGALLRLPLGQHPETGRFSVLLMPDGQPAADPWSLLSKTPFVNLEKLLGIGQPQECPELPEPPERIAPMVKGCALIWGLVQKAAQLHHLRHVERLALLYTLGHCGEAGQTYLHQVIALCSNYNPRITQRWIQRLDEGHRPIRCGTLWEWLKDLLPNITCPFIPRSKDPTPIDLLQ
ncbi:MAG: CRISPR-associated primase-polymerase type A1, partial [Armatimonadota bacterium]